MAGSRENLGEEEFGRCVVQCFSYIWDLEYEAIVPDRREVKTVMNVLLGAAISAVPGGKALSLSERFLRAASAGMAKDFGSRAVDSITDRMDNHLAMSKGRLKMSVILCADGRTFVSASNLGFAQYASVSLHPGKRVDTREEYHLRRSQMRRPKENNEFLRRVEVNTNLGGNDRNSFTIKSPAMNTVIEYN
ncbi:MAG: hypothetical protein JJU36_07215 [Phycisphaeraceae bacterium]|nr:hypothetical protein [Phycisphaeraceae bacterium]